MEADWYKPAPGEPYRLLIALPDRVRSLDPMWEACTEAFYFTGLDPPRALHPGTSMVAPAVTASDPSVTPNPVQPMPSLPTITGSAPKILGNDALRTGKLLVPEPSADIPPAAKSPAGSAPVVNPQPHPGDPSDETTSINPPSSLHFGSGPQDANPNSMSPAQLSQLSQALAPAPSPASNPVSKPTTTDPNAEPGAGPVNPVVEPGTDGTTAVGAGKSSPAPSPAHIVLGSSTYQLPQVTAQPVPVPTVAGTPLVDVGGGNYKVGSQILSPGGATANVGGTSVHINPQGTPVVGSQTYSPVQIAATTTIGSHTLVANTAGVIVDGQQIQPNASPADVGGVPVQIQSPAVGNSPAGTDPASATDPAPILNVPGAQALTQIPSNPNAYMLAGTTLLPGSSAAVISVASYSLAPSGVLIIGTSTVPLATAAAGSGANGALTAGNKVFTPLGSTAIEVNGATLSLNGSATTDDGAILSLASGGVVVGSFTYAYATPAHAPNASATTQEVPITTALNVAGQTFIANPSDFGIAETAISAGGPGMTISGTPVVLESGGNLVIGSSTVPLESTSIGTAASSTAVTFEGSAVRMKVPCWGLMAGPLALLASRLYVVAYF